MEQLKIINYLKGKYAESLSKWKFTDSNPFNPDIYLFQKWSYKIGKGWYGFALGDVPFIWAEIINEFLEYLLVTCPNFEINQIKLKFGGLRFYVELNQIHGPTHDQVEAEIEELEEWLFHKELIY